MGEEESQKQEASFYKEYCSAIADALFSTNIEGHRDS